LIGQVRPPKAVEMTKELVGAVDQMDDHMYDIYNIC
jgi:hypothetical protein